MSGHRTDLPAEKPDLSAESVLFNALSASIAPACPEESHVHDLRGRLLARRSEEHTSETPVTSLSRMPSSA